MIITGAGRGSVPAPTFHRAPIALDVSSRYPDETRTIGGTVADVSRFVFTSARNLSSVLLTVPAWVSVHDDFADGCTPGLNGGPHGVCVYEEASFLKRAAVGFCRRLLA